MSAMLRQLRLCGRGIAAQRLRGLSGVPQRSCSAPDSGDWVDGTDAVAEASLGCTMAIACSLVGVGYGSWYLLKSERQAMHPARESFPPGSFARLPRLSAQAGSSTWACEGDLPQWQEKTLHLRGGSYYMAAVDRAATASIAGRFAADCEVIRLQSNSATSLGVKGSSEVACLRVADLCPPDAVEGGVVTVELMPGFGLLDLYGQPGLYHVQDQSGLRSVEQARGGKYSATDFFSGRKDRIARSLDALLEASDTEQPRRLQVLVNDRVATIAEAGQVLQLGDSAAGTRGLVSVIAQLLDSRSDAYALLPMILRGQCAGGPSLRVAASELREVLARHTSSRQISEQDITTSLQRGFWSLPPDQSGLHLREREAERLLERARRELWAEGSASRKELEKQIEKFLCLHQVGSAACAARLRFSFARPAATPTAQETLSSHGFSPSPGLPGLWWRLQLAPLELPEF